MNTTYDDLKWFFGNRIEHLDNSVLNNMLNTDDIMDAHEILFKHEMEVNRNE